MPQRMIFDNDHPDYALRGKAKGIRQVLGERGLWRERRADGFRFLLLCPKTHDRPGCDPGLNGECCNSATPISKGFRGAEGSFARRHYARENCEYNLNGLRLRKTLPAAFKSVSTASINRYYQHCCRIIEAYIDGHKYGTEAFVERPTKAIDGLSQNGNSMFSITVPYKYYFMF